MPTLGIAGRTDVFAGGSWRAAFVIGWVSILLGVVMMAWPGKSVRVTTLLFALCLLLTALWQVLVAFRARIAGGLRVLAVAAAVLAVVLAVWCLQSGDWVQLLALWVGLGWALHGVAQAIVAVWTDLLDSSARHEIYGLLTLAAGVVLVLSPVQTLAALSVLIGALLIPVGAIEIRTAARVARRAQGREVGMGDLLRSNR
jgi:uncharacterized membrane protein HdeD (DUF308 family)